MADSAIHWTDKVWNPVIGCTRVSPGCEHCYAEALAPRLAAMGQTAYEGLTRKHGDGSVTWTGTVKCLPERLEEPLRWKKPARVFVNSMSDLFHDEVPDRFIDQVFAVMSVCSQHTFQVLTKRPERMRDYLLEQWQLGQGETKARDRGMQVLSTADDLFGNERLDELWNPERPANRALEFLDELELPRWPLRNVWLGVSVENQAVADTRILALTQTPAAVRFISAEPLLGTLDLFPWATTHLRCVHDNFAPEADSPCEPCGCWPDRAPLDWVITGAESGPKRRPFDEAWARSIRDQCQAAGVAYFHKQGSGPRPGLNRELDGQVWEQFPEAKGA